MTDGMPTLIERLVRVLLALVAVAIVSGCASTTPGDPFETYNRKVYSFNSAVDNAVLKPTATAYKNYVPLAFRSIAGNFFANLADVWTGANNLLQAKPTAALNDFTRVLLNTTFGFAGIADPASEMGWERNREDFGQTLGVWGVPPGPYFVLPFFGPSSIRGTGGFAVDWFADPMGEVIQSDDLLVGAIATRIVDQRAKFLGAGKVLQGAALDEYSFIRNSYRQRRLSAVYDGEPPERDEGSLLDDEDDFLDEDDEKPATEK